jgi:hypothetical protein
MGTYHHLKCPIIIQRGSVYLYYKHIFVLNMQQLSMCNLVPHNVFFHIQYEFSYLQINNTKKRLKGP